MEYFVIDPETSRKYGPASVEILREWAQQGRLEAATPLEETLTGTRLTAAQLPGLGLGPKLQSNANSQQEKFTQQAADYINTSQIWAVVGIFTCFLYMIPTFFCGLIGMGYAWRAGEIGHPMATNAFIFSLIVAASPFIVLVLIFASMVFG